MIRANAILEINTKNLIYNYKHLSKIAKNSICASTIKANAYGIGDLQILEILYENNCRHFFVATLDEAIKIRKKRKNIYIYVLNGLECNDINIFIKKDIIPIINSIEDLFLIIKNDISNKKIKYGIHIDTGLNRLGININELKKINVSKLDLVILISHLASADEKKNLYNKVQNLNFQNSFKYFKKTKYKSLSNSMGLLLGKEYFFDMVRPGISLYGGHFNTRMKRIIKPVICLKAKILQIKEINKDEFIGYNQTVKTKKKIKVAILGIGYADGINRILSNKGNVFLKDKIFKIIGRVSMDTITIDITKNYKMIRVGNYIEVINNKYGIDYMAEKSGTICDEVLTSISERVKRIYR